MNYSKQELVKKITAHRKKEGIEGKALSAMKQGVLLGLAKRYNLVGKDSTVGAVKKGAKSPAKKGAKSPAKKCEAGKVMNPATGRCVSRSGKIGMALAGKKGGAKKGGNKKSSTKKVGAALCPGKITRSGSQLKLREKESTSKKCVYTRSKSPTKKQ